MTDANEAPAATPDAAPAGVPVAAPDAAPAGVPLEPGVHSPGYSGKGTPVGGGGAEGPFTAGVPDIVRPHAEDQYAAELAALAAADDRPRPPSWKLSPWAVATYLHAVTNTASARVADASGFPDTGWWVLGLPVAS